MGLLKSAGDSSRKVILLKEKTAFEHRLRIEHAAVSALISSLLQETAKKIEETRKSKAVVAPEESVLTAHWFNLHSNHDKTINMGTFTVSFYDHIVERYR